MSKKFQHIDNLNQGETVIGGKKLTLYYVGEKSHFDNLMKEVCEKEVYKPLITDKNDIILDVGGYIGSTALYFAQYAKKVYVLEPSEVAYELLLENVKQNPFKGEIIPIKKGLDDYDGKGRIFTIGDDRIGSSLLCYSPRGKSWEIDVTRLDTFLKEYGIDHVDGLKMDIEGTEYRILRGEGFTSVADKIDRIILESHPYAVPGEASGEPWEVPYLLKQVGYEVKHLREEGDLQWAVKVQYTDGKLGWQENPNFLGVRI